MEGVPNRWHVYFALENMEAALAKAGELGASVVAGLSGTPTGRMAALSDPKGRRSASTPRCERPGIPRSRRESASARRQEQR